MRTLIYCSTVFCFAVIGVSFAAAEPRGVSFSREIAPLLNRKCQACHGVRLPEGEYQLVSFETLMKPGASSEPAVAPGKPDESELFRLIASSDEDERMPKQAAPLSPEEVNLIRRWISEGATFDGVNPKSPLVTIAPRPTNPDPPEVYSIAVPIAAIAFSPDGKELATGGLHEVCLWNPATGSLLHRIKDVPERVLGLAFSPDGATLAVAGGVPGESGEVTLYDGATGRLIKNLGLMTDVEFRVAFSRDGQRLAACGADRSIRLWNVASGREERFIEHHSDWVVDLAFSHDGKKLASASRDKTAKLFDADTGNFLTTYSGHGEPVHSVAFSGDDTRVYSGGRGKIHLWKPDDATKIAEISDFVGDVFALVATRDSVFAVGADTVGKQFSVDKHQVVQQYAGHGDWIYSAARHESTNRLATGSFDGEVRIWNADGGSLLKSFRAAPGAAPR